MWHCSVVACGSVAFVFQRPCEILWFLDGQILQYACLQLTRSSYYGSGIVGIQVIWRLTYSNKVLWWELKNMFILFDVIIKVTVQYVAVSYQNIAQDKIIF